jgi:ribosomal subunit interface protein
MKLTVTGRQVVVSQTTRQTLDRKLRRLDRVLQERAISAQCVLARQREAYICELTVHVRGDHVLHGVGRQPKIPAALAEATDKVALQAQKLIDRWKTRHKNGS